MTLRQRYRNWILQRRWRKARRNENEPLREFVYLDEVSVYSLVASQIGMIVTS
jgi:phage terminase large subunit GpA-like protein